jgi:hypothetical protein
MGLEELAKRLQHFADERDWEQFHSPKNLAMALSAEAGELLEIFQYVTRAREAGLVWPLPAEMDEAVLEARLLRRPRSPTGPRPQPDVARIHRELKRQGVSLHLLWVEYLEDHPEGYRYSQFCEIYRRHGWERMRRLLADAGKPDVPGLYIARNCMYTWATLPFLGRDPRRPDDVDSRGADHAADALRYACVHEIPKTHSQELLL